MQRVFAKPFLGSLDGHRDGVHCMRKHPKQLSTLLTGACDGELRIWNLPTRECTHIIPAHDGFVRAMCFHPDGQYMFTCGDDKTIKQWSLASEESANDEPMNTIVGKDVFISMDHSLSENSFATCGHAVNIWDESRSEPIRTYNWGVDSITSIRYNPVENGLLGGYGIRSKYSSV